MNLLQNTLFKPLLSFNVENVDDLFPGFAMGDFAVLHGMSSISSLASLLAVLAQLPVQLGGLGTRVVFVDGGNSFKLYEVSRIAQLHQLNPREVLEGIIISRAFTAYQMATLVMEKLKETVEQFSSKFVLVSDITGLFLDKDIPLREAKEVFNQLPLHLAKLAEENHIAVLATCLPHHSLRSSSFFKENTCGRANVVLSVKPSKFGQSLFLEKHQSLRLGYAEFPSEALTLDKFMET
jgi:hypothetical protein